ncbi:MAG: Gx transporter family protein [Desulfosalsimonadaceae bacterium]
MTESHPLTNTATLPKIALLTAVACVLQISESMIPHPVPGLRLGLANMITLVALVVLGFRPAMEIAVCRTLLSSLILGTFMSPTFILSVAGAVISTLAMGFFMRIARLRSHFRPSIIGISILGALIHNLVQLYLAYLLLIRHGGIFVFLPWLCMGALVMGWVTGTVAGSVCRRLAENRHEERAPGIVLQEDDGIRSYHYIEGASLLHRLSPEFKIGALICLSIVSLIINDFRMLSGFFLFPAFLAAVSKIPPGYLISKIGRFSSLIMIAFLLPVFFNPGTHILYKIGSFAVTQEGVLAGSIIGMRIVILIALSAILMRTTSINEITRGLTTVLLPLRYIGVCEKRTAMILSLAWTALPVIRQAARRAIKNGNFSNVRNLRNLMPLLSRLICDLYMETEPGSVFLESAAKETAAVKEQAQAVD